MLTHDDGLSLGSEEYARALSILKNELQALRPTPRQERAYRLLNWNIAAFFVAYPLVILGALVKSTSQIVYLTIRIPGIVLLFVTALMLPLFLLNLGLVRKLFHVARFRRRLGLQASLAAAFQAQRRRTRFRNFLTKILVCWGVMILSSPLILFLPLRPLLPSHVLLLSALLPPFIIGIPVVSLHFIRREKERFAVVERLSSSLQAAVADPRRDPSTTIPISAADYDLVATIERDQIISERYRSIERSPRDAKDSSYAVQIGFAAQRSKSQLPTAERLLIDDRILQLMEDPQPAGVITDSGLRRVPVPGTGAEIVCEVDDTSRQIRIIRIESTASAHINEPKASG